MIDKIKYALLIILIVGVFSLFTWLIIPRYELTEVLIVKIHTVEDYKAQTELGVKQGSYPHIVYEVIETKERFKEKTSYSMGEVGETITINRQVGGMR
jgi:hypothetical protein